MNRTKIVCTIGPRTANPGLLRQLVDAGMGIARLNGSHADLDWHARAIRLLREVAPGVPVLLDIPGRKIRTASLAHEPSFDAGATVVLTTDAAHDGREKVPVSSDTLHADLRPGDTILADDGTLRFTVLRIEGRDIHCRAETPGTLRSRKGVNVPHVKLQSQLVTSRDRQMIEFARANGVDFVGISFVDSAAHVGAIRELIGDAWPRIVAKIENQGGLDRVEEIVEATDAVMIDRGDLSVETSPESLSLFQKRIIAAARGHGRPVIVATEMLHTMIANPFPTKAEISDITNAVLDGCAATMLSGETAIGDHPVEAVSVMRRVATVAEEYVQSELDARPEQARGSVPQAVGDAIAMICRTLPVTCIVAVTKSGYAARTIAARRPRQPILAVSNDEYAARSFNLYAGTEGIFVDIEFPQTSTDHIIKCLEILWQRGKLTDDDLVLVTAVGYPRSGNRMNLLQTHYLRDLITTLGWRR